jgi:hypothetical protein
MPASVATIVENITIFNASGILNDAFGFVLSKAQNICVYPNRHIHELGIKTIVWRSFIHGRKYIKLFYGRFLIKIILLEFMGDQVVLSSVLLISIG